MAPSSSRSLALDPIPSVRGLHQLISERRLAAILSQTGRGPGRHRRLPADSVIWLVIAMALFAADPIPKVWRRLHPGRDEPEPTESASARARRRLGVAPLRHLSPRVARPMAIHQTRGVTHAGWNLMGIDGATLDLPDTPTNARAFGRPGGGRAAGAFPQVRLLALGELGTHAVCGLAIKPPRHGGPSMVGQLLDQLGPGLLLIWDRGSFGHELVRSIHSSGAHLMARVQCNSRPGPLRRLDYGSYTARLYPSPADRRRDVSGLMVRVIESAHDDPNRPGAGRRHRLIADVLNPADLPACEAPVIYLTNRGGSRR